MSAQGEGEDTGPEEGLDNMLFFGGVTFSLTITLVMIYILIDLGINVDLYTPSYIFGAIFFIALNFFANLAFAMVILDRERKWWVLALVAVAFVTILWVFHGLGQPWRTFAIAGIGYAGLALVVLSWLTRPNDASVG